MISDRAAFIRYFQTISQDEKVLIVVHRDPDLDAIGSALAFSMQLTALGVENKIWVADKLGADLLFLPSVETIVSDYPKDFNYSLLLALDCANLERIKDYEKLNMDVKSINVDHHADNTGFADINVCETISSVGELLVSLFQELSWPMTKDIATVLYAAIAFDTGQFKFSNTTKETFSAVQVLLESGIDINWISDAMHDQKSEAYLEMLKLALDNVTIHKHYVSVAIPKTDLDYGSEIVNLIRKVKNKLLVLSFRELFDGEVKISLRSKTDFDVAAFSAQFGGGGHKKASGIRMKGPLTLAQTQVFEALDTALSEYLKPE